MGARGKSVQRHNASESHQCGSEGKQQGAPGVARREDDDSESKREESDATDGIGETHGAGGC